MVGNLTKQTSLQQLRGNVDCMETSNLAFLTLPSRPINNGSPKKSLAISHHLINALEKDEAKLVAEGATNSARRFRNDIGVLQRRNRRYDRAPPSTGVAVLMRPEASFTALMEVYEEEEELEPKAEKLPKIEDISHPTSVDGRLSREEFLKRSKAQLARPEDVLSQKSITPTVLELNAALSTSLAHNSRLMEQRHTQFARCLQLHRQVNSLSAELDASVDNLRHQRSRWEAERRKSTMEARELRQQLAEALAALQSVSRHTPNDVAPMPRGSADQGAGCALCEQCTLETSALRIAVERLEDEVTRQQRGAEQEAAQWAVQLADAAAENRSLRLQLSRSAAAVVSTSAVANATDTNDSCVNCRRLQKLVDLLQAKRSNAGVATLQPDLIPAVCDNFSLVCEAEVQTECGSECTSEDDSEDSSLFHILESGGRVDGLKLSYFERQTGGLAHPQTTCKSPPPRPTPTSSQPDAVPSDVSRLLARLRMLEAEVESSADQLKASNEEFLQLRERLTRATVEKTHLKATVDGLDDQVTQLESALYSRTQELRKCQAELSKFQEPQSCVLRLADDVGPLATSPPRTVLRDTSSKFRKLALSYANAASRCWNRPLVTKFGPACTVMVARVFETVGHRVLGSRRPRVFLCLLLLIYLSFLHILLVSCLLQ